MDKYQIRLDHAEAEMGEEFCLTITSDGADVVGLTIKTDGTAVLITWPDGENNETVELPTHQP